MADKISVIIPVYNVAAYLSQCLDSVLGQDHRDLEVIVVDDGSTDSSGAICDQYAAKDSRVRVIHQANAGAAAAKNAGLRVATGEYLSFVDADDYLEPNVYGYMLRILQRTQADAAQFSFREVYVNHQEEKLLDMGCPKMDSKTYLVRFTKDWSCPLLWNKLYRREIFAGVFFEEGHKIDDEYFTYQGFLEQRRVVFDTKVVYNYRRRRSSVMASPAGAKQRVLDCMDSIAKRRQKVIGVYPELKAAFDENYLDALCYLSTNPACTPDVIDLLKSNLKGYLKQWGNTFPPRYLWPALLRLYFVPTSQLMQRRSAETEIDTNAEDCFE